MSLAALFLGVAAYVAFKNWKIVRTGSLALEEQRSLNRDCAPHLRRLPPIRYDWVDPVNSKAKFDRYDLVTFLLECLASMESVVQQQIDERMAGAANFADYARKLEQIRLAQLGRSGSKKLSAKRYKWIEQKLFARETLKAPGCFAEIRISVTYRSPKGQNSYQRGLIWNFDELCLAMDAMRGNREQRTTAAFMRQQERNRMTRRVRAEILTRDQYRCQMCGASAAHGAILHVDHIIPVSRGGQTVHGNLQALCQDCNLGKSDVL